MEIRELAAADRDAAIAATAMVGHDGHRGGVYYVAVRHTERRSGIGRRMMQEAEAWLRERGVVKLNLMVRHSDAEALGFYQCLGYDDAEVKVLVRWLRAPERSTALSHDRRR